MNKLVLIFNEGNEVSGIEKGLIFHNEVDASEYLFLKGLYNIKIELDDNWFSFKTETGWSGNGKAFWAKQH